MSSQIQKLTFWFYIWFFCTLSCVSTLVNSLQQPAIVILSQLIILSVFLCISFIVLSKRQKAIHNLKSKPDFQSLYQHETITACIVLLSSVIDIFFLTNISKVVYLIAVFYHLYWFIKKYPLSTMSSK